MKAEAQKEHHWLAQLDGEWTYEGECDMGPDQPSMKMQGRETVRSIGELWRIAEGRSGMPDGGEAHTVMTLGYDAAKGRYVGSYVASMMTMMWLYEGSLDASGRVLTLDCEGPDFSGDGSIAKYQDIIEIVDADTRLFRSQTFRDGAWREFLRSRYRRA